MKKNVHFSSLLEHVYRAKICLGQANGNRRETFPRNSSAKQKCNRSTDRRIWESHYRRHDIGERNHARVISDINGRFSIRVAVGETLSFSFIGYENVEKKVTSETEVFNIRMIEESTSLKDVVIVGFGKQKKASVVGAISSVKPESFKLPTSSLSASLAGRMSGVIAVQRSGEPGGDGADFWIRGIGTNGANSAPLILLDGVEISSGDLNDIQPDDIQSFSILKDASATALYGVRGANGVMIVTTKEGATNEKISVKARLENSWSMPSYHLDMVDGPTYMRMYNEA